MKSNGNDVYDMVACYWNIVEKEKGVIGSWLAFHDRFVWKTAR